MLIIIIITQTNLWHVAFLKIYNMQHDLYIDLVILSHILFECSRELQIKNTCINCNSLLHVCTCKRSAEVLCTCSYIMHAIHWLLCSVTFSKPLQMHIQLRNLYKNLYFLSLYTYKIIWRNKISEKMVLYQVIISI